MKLIDVLRNLEENELHQRAKSLGITEAFPLPLLISRLEQSIKSPKHIDLTISLCKPPVLAIFQVILEKKNYSMVFSEFKKEVLIRNSELTSLVTSKKLVSLKEHELYRKILIEAWRNDLRIDSNELSLLNVLRQELGLSQIDHFLIAQHEELIPYFREINTFDTVVKHLIDGCIIFLVKDEIIVPSELIGLIRESIGLFIDSSKFIRLLDLISSDSLSNALVTKKLATSGTKQEKINRLIENFITPFDVLSLLTLEDLKNISDSVGCKKTGIKEELISRLVTYFHNDNDVILTNIEDEIEYVEDKILKEEEFIQLFSNFETSMLILLASRNDSKRKTGSKLDIVRSLWGLPVSEYTILSSMSNDDIRSELRKRELNTMGSKTELINRIINSIKPMN